MEGKTFLVRTNLSRAFVIPDETLRAALGDGSAKKRKLIVSHPLGKLTYVFDKKNTERIKSWLQPTPAVQEAHTASPQ